VSIPVATQEASPVKIEDGERSWMDDDERWIAARDLAASPSFVRSPRLGQLLLFLVSKTLTGERWRDLRTGDRALCLWQE
jgi:hypothetical protein